jgi:hypothetical protein
MFYVVHKLATLLQIAIHLDVHEHPVKKFINRESFDDIKLLVEKEVFCTPDVKNFAIALAASKTFLA